MNPKKLSKESTVGVIAPSRPIYTRKGEFKRGLKILKDFGFNIKLGKNINKHDYYSAGTSIERAYDLSRMFADKKVNTIICATGGITSNQIINLIDYKLVKNNPKTFIGYSDNTNLLLSIFKKTGLTTYYGPDVCEIGNLSDEALKKYEGFLRTGATNISTKFNTIKAGKGKGKLIGGTLFSICGLLATQYLPKLDNAILFWEDTGESPAKIDFLLNQLKLSTKLENLSAMIIGHLDDCTDKKYPQDNKPIEEIVKTVFQKYNFPIIKVENFGHEIKNSEIIPIGMNCEIDTKNNRFKLV